MSLVLVLFLYVFSTFCHLSLIVDEKVEVISDHFCRNFLLLMIFVDNSNYSCYVFQMAFIKKKQKLVTFICLSPIILSSFVKYSIYGPHVAVMYSICSPKNIFRVGNIIHRVARKRSLWIGTTRNCFLV